LIREQSATGFIIRKESKEHGLGRQVEGPELTANTRVVIVEDVVTSAGSVLRGIKAVEETGARIVKVIALVDREAGGREALTGAGYDYEPIFTRAALT
jgi:orotate phosphoribosyltransferase